jgi:hypothetical protein
MNPPEPEPYPINQCIKTTDMGNPTYARYKGTETLGGTVYRKIKTRTKTTRIEKKLFSQSYNLADNDAPCINIAKGGRKTRRKRSKRRKTHRR